ncbi:MAG: photosystem II protein PsbQ [Cyanothece sp. SIO2G6]|nr:photosystem II protein PsbQ [Cyanothece sp. SIO2G6]
MSLDIFEPMRQYRAVLSLLLAVFAVFLVSCSGGPSTSQGPTYTDAEMQLLQSYKATIAKFRDRATELDGFIQQQEWNDIKSLIHGPLGELRFRLSTVARSLEPKAQSQAKEVADDTLRAIVLVDEAAARFDPAAASIAYDRLIQDFDRFLDLIPDFESGAA